MHHSVDFHITLPVGTLHHVHNRHEKENSSLKNRTIAQVF